MGRARRPYSKAGHNQNLQQLIGRTRGSIEYKHQNISAVLQLLGEVWIQGYRPALNFQRSLVDAVERWLDANPQYLARPLVPENPTRLAEPEHLWIGPPPSHSNEPPPQELEKVFPIMRKFDFPGSDERNRALGLAGEKLILAHERANLIDAGRFDLAERVRWISQEDGDGAGYDIASFFPQGKSRLIEVKTTCGWERTPFGTCQRL